MCVCMRIMLVLLGLLFTNSLAAGSDAFLPKITSAEAEEGAVCPTELWNGLLTQIARGPQDPAFLGKVLKLAWQSKCGTQVVLFVTIYRQLENIDRKGALKRFVDHAPKDKTEALGEELYFAVDSEKDVALGLSLLKEAHAGADLDLIAQTIAGKPARSPKFSADFSLFQIHRNALEGKLPSTNLFKAFAKELEVTPSPDKNLHDILWLTQDQRTAARWFAMNVASSSELAVMLEKSASPAICYEIGSILIEGATSDRDTRGLGLKLIEVAADKGLSEAQYRFGVALEFDPTLQGRSGAAAHYYELAAKSGERAAAVALARRAESGPIPDLSAASVWYKRSLSLSATVGEGWDSNSNAGVSYERALEAGSAFLNSKAGEDFLISAAEKNRALAEEIGDLYECVECDTVANLGTAATWFRRAIGTVDPEDDSEYGKEDAAFKLAKILMARPDLAANSTELTDLLERFKELPKVAALRVISNPKIEQMNLQDIGNDLQTACQGSCTDVYHDLAIGFFGPRLITVGFKLLKSSIDQSDGVIDADPYAALIDVLAFYGDFSSASQMLDSTNENIVGGLSTFDARLPTIRRLISDKIFTPATGPALVQLLKSLVRHEDFEAPRLLEAIENPDAPIAPHDAGALIPDQLQKLTGVYGAQRARGGPTIGLVSATRRLSSAYSAAGEMPSALQFEIVALNTELELDQTRSITEGNIPTILRDVCLLTNSSRRVLAFGYPGVANVLAKRAVNQLQQVRSDIAALPEDLQTCFADTASNSYRWLADLFFAQGDRDSFNKVLSMLKEFEKFSFVDRDVSPESHPFYGLDLNLEEVTIGDALDTVKNGDYFVSRQIRSLTSTPRTLSESDKAQLNDLRSKSEKQQEKIDAAIETIKNFRSPDSLALNNMKKDNTALVGDGALLQYVVLPDKMEAMLTTKDGRFQHVWLTVDGAPFTEARLNQKIAAFRDEVSDSSSCATDASEDLYNFLLAPFAQPIAGSGAQTLILQLDKRLRYVPFSALRQGSHYIVENFSVLRVGSRVNSTRNKPLPMKIAAVGVSKESDDLPALPEVPRELGLLVNDGTSLGLLKGEVAIDDAFTEEKLAQMLHFGGSRGILHIASHFVIGANDNESHLAIGDGVLSVKEFRHAAAGNGFLGLGQVDLLTLSACNTAFNDSTQDGNQIDTFADEMFDEGPNAILASLWEVPDVSTPYFMRRFYQLSLKDNERKADALATVMREFISGNIIDSTIAPASSQIPDAKLSTYSPGRFQHPFYWAPFELFEGN